MSVAEILEELPHLTAEERRLVADLLEVLDDLLEGQCELIDQRIREHEAAPDSVIPLDQFHSTVKASLMGGDYSPSITTAVPTGTRS